MSIDPLSEDDQPQRTVRKRRRLSPENRNGGRKFVAPFPPEDRSFRVWFLSNETGISVDQASELVDKIEMDGAALLNAARRMKIHAQ